MERHQKLRESMIADELAVTRAAAWAWYRRGSGSEPKPGSEFGLARTHQYRVPNPTRYKLEAERSRSSTSDHGSHLLDRYEIDSISRHLEKYIERVNNGDLGSHRRAVFSPGSEVSGVIKTEGKKVEAHENWPGHNSCEKTEEEKKKKSSKGFWLTRHGVACGGSRDDVVEFGRRVVRERRPPEKCGGGAVQGAEGSQVQVVLGTSGWCCAMRYTTPCCAHHCTSPSQIQ
ncbi:uncharacterized protein LOC131303165 [Rhododendron vialii]|uniref:uncharacterized protein LOC131303165 n=1 Tax=Rhododendron vialii TaxID=182163 RepID=UPI00265E54F3|nr:uncharacterized protein LOC131303165 [Rhododendron vialii]